MTIRISLSSVCEGFYKSVKPVCTCTGYRGQASETGTGNLNNVFPVEGCCNCSTVSQGLLNTSMELRDTGGLSREEEVVNRSMVSGGGGDGGADGTARCTFAGREG